jgi:hypothetical protein
MGVLLAGGTPCTFTLLTTLDMVIASESTRLMCATPGEEVVGVCGAVGSVGGAESGELWWLSRGG